MRSEASAVPRVNVLGVGVSALNLESAGREILGAVETPGFQGFITITGVHGVAESQSDEELKRIHNRSFLTTPDGMPMVWLGRWQGFREMDRVYGPDLMLALMEKTAGTPHRHYLFGGGEGVAEDLGRKLASRFPGVRISGTNTPPFRPLEVAEENSFHHELQTLRPHFVWVGLSTPKQEKFMHGFLGKFPDLTQDWDHGLVMLGVGAAFDFHSGRARQAPRWIQRSGFEWFFRVCMNPRRLWKRYLVSNSLFLRKIIPQMMDLKKYPMPR